MTAFILKQLRKDQKGFTLIELLAVIVILGVIAAIAVPLIGGVINKSKKDSDLATAGQFYQAARLYITAEKDSVSISEEIKVSDLMIASAYIDANLVLPSTRLPITGGIVKYNSLGVLDSVTMITTDGTYTCGGTIVIAGKGKCLGPV